MNNHLTGIAVPLEYKEEWATKDALKAFMGGGECEICGETSSPVVFCPFCCKTHCLDRCIKIEDIYENPESKSVWTGTIWKCPKCSKVVRKWRIVR